MSEVPQVGMAMKVAGWRQGSVLPQPLVDRFRLDGLLPAKNSSGEIWIVISHDCDITNPSLDAEPEAEILRLCLIDPQQVDGNYEWCKNPRSFDIRKASRSSTDAYHIAMRDRRCVPRAGFICYGPDAARELSSVAIEQISLWLTRRYKRAAFPDTFNERCRPAVATLRKEFKSKGGLFTALYVTPDERELPPGKDYRIGVIASLRPEVYDDGDLRADAQRLLDKVETELQACKGICVATAELRSEADISLDDIRLLRRWDFDDMSIRGQPPLLPPQV